MRLNSLAIEAVIVIINFDIIKTRIVVVVVIVRIMLQSLC